MIPYLIIFSVVIASVVWVEYKEEDTKKCFISLFVIILLFSGLRGNGNGDYFKYLELYDQYNRFGSLFYVTHVEYGFRLLSILLNTLRLPGQSIIFAMSSITLGVSFITIYKGSKDKILSIFLLLPFVLAFDMQTSRNAIAIAIGFYALSEYKKPSIKYFILLFCGYLFHKTIIILVFYPVFDLILGKLNKLKKIILVLIFVLISILFRNHDLVINLVNMLRIPILRQKVSWYLNSEYFYPFKLYDPRLIILLFELIIIQKLNIKITKKYMIFLWLNILTLVLLSSYTLLAIRMSAYFNIFQVIIIPEILHQFTDVNFMIKSTNVTISRKAMKCFFVVFNLVILLLMLKNYYVYYPFWI